VTLRPPLRMSLLALLLLMTMAFAATLIWAIGSYERFTVASLQSAKVATLSAVISQKLTDEFEPSVLDMTRGLASLAGLANAIAGDDRPAAHAILQNGTKQLLVTNQHIKLIDIVLLDAEFRPLAALTETDYRTGRPGNFLGQLRRGSAAERRYVAGRYMLDEENRPIYVLVHPIGTFKVSGYIGVLTSPVTALTGLAAAVGADLVISAISGEVLAEEKFEQLNGAPPDSHYDRLTTRVAVREAMPVDFALTFDASSFERAATGIRRVSYIVGAAMVMLTAIFALLTLQFTVFSRISAITLALRRIVAGDTSVIVPEGGSDEIGSMSRDLQRVIGYVRESAMLKESIAANVELEREVLERRKAEQAAAEAKEEADAANHAKSEFLTNMSHEVRTPMNGILGMNRILLQTELTPDQRDCAIAVRDSAEALLTVVNDILDVSKLDAGKVALEIIDFDLVETVDGAVGLLAPKAQEKSIELSVFVDPAARSGFRGDPTRLRQVLLNLVGNAVKFTEQGGVSVEVTVGRGAAGELPRIHFSVSDTGIGMSEDARTALFQKFTQADSSITRRFGGSGLGLAISKQLVELMDGEIGVESVAGSGTRVWFAVALRPAATPTIACSSAPKQLKGLRALIVDDLEMNLRILKHHLDGFGMETSSADDGFQAIAELEHAWHRGRPFDLVIIDQLMPGLSGEELARRIRAMPGIAETKLVIASSAGRHGVSRTAHHTVDAVLTKPVREPSLLEVFTRLFGINEPASTEAAPVAPTASAPIVSMMPIMRPLRILVAEDNRINRKIVGILLDGPGHRVEMVENGEQAVAAVCNADYDVVLMDVQMPVLDGMQATKQIRALPPHKSGIPIIALTAHAMAGAREQYLAAGMDDYLSKPLDPATLYAKLAEVTSVTPAASGERAGAEHGPDDLLASSAR
jgi:signal transduction histidine kinase/DNA-binding response OmpR family regulator